MKKKYEEAVEGEKEEKELTPKELRQLKKKERQEGAEKRRKAKQKDKVARFAGAILLGMVLLLGFLLWVAGEMRTEERPGGMGGGYGAVSPVKPSSPGSEIIRVR